MRLIEILVLLLLAACCSAEPLTTLITIPRTSKPPVLDGVISPEEWSGAARIPYFVTVSGGAPDQPTTAWMCCDERSLFFAFECGEDRMPELKASVTEHDGIVWRDDSIELFIQPGSGLPYYHIAVNSLGATYDAVNRKIMESDVSWESGLKAAASRGESAWFVEIEIPIAGFGVGAVKPGDSWRVNLCRQRKAFAENSSWSPLRFGEATFADPERFGTLVFGGEEAPLVELDEFAGLPNGLVRRSGRIANPSGRAIELSLETVIPERREREKIAVPAGKAQEFGCTDNTSSEGSLISTLEVVSGGRIIYRAVRPFDVPPIRSRVAALVERLRGVDAPALKDRIGACARQAALAHKSPPERVGEIMDALDGLEREALAVRLGVEGDFAVWAADPWVQLRPDDLPPWDNLPAECRAIACRGERVYAAANITNFSGRALDLRIVPGPFGGLPPGRIKLHTCAFVPVEAGSEEMIGDALPLADGAGRVVVPSGETRQAFLVIRTDGLKPGEYSGPIRVVPAGGGPAQEVALRFTVYPLDLPADPKPWICTWGGLLNIGWTKPNQKEYFRDALDRGVNIFFMNPASVAPKLRADGSYPPIDFTRLDRQIREHAPIRRAVGAYNVSVQFTDWAEEAGIPYMSDAYRKAFVSWMRDWIERVKSLGLSYDDFAFELVDEPAPEEKLRMHIDTGRLLREADPRARVVCTANFPELDKLRRIEPFVDIWVPQGKVLEDSAAREFMKRTGKEMWMYVCEGDSKRRPPVAYYRAVPWQAFRHDLAGWGFFAHMWQGESPWDAASASGKYLATYSTVYPGLNGPVTSRRWECYFKGHEDFRALHLLKSLVERAEKAGLDASEARKVLEEARDGSAGLREMEQRNGSAAETSAFLADIRRRAADAAVKLSEGWREP